MLPWLSALLQRQSPIVWRLIQGPNTVVHLLPSTQRQLQSASAWRLLQRVTTTSSSRGSRIGSRTSPRKGQQQGGQGRRGKEGAENKLTDLNVENVRTLTTWEETESERRGIGAAGRGDHGRFWGSHERGSFFEEVVCRGQRRRSRWDWRPTTGVPSSWKETRSWSVSVDEVLGCGC